MKAVESKITNYLVKQLPNATALVDTDQKLVAVSDSWLDIFNEGKNVSLGKHISLFFKSHQDSDGKNFAESFIDGQFRQKRHAITLNNQKRWFQSTASPWFDDKENVLGTIIQTDDITDKVETEFELERIKTLFKEKSEVAKVGCWEYDIATEELFWCEETKKIHEVAADYVPNVAEGIDFYKKGYSRNRIAMLFHKAVEDGSSYSERLVVVTKKGKELWVKASGKPIFENGKVVKLFGTFQDVNEQVTAELKREENERLMSTLIDNLPLNVFIKDKDSRKVLVNKAECDYLGLSPKQLIGKTDFDLYDKNVAQISRDEDLEVIRTQKPILGKETISVKKDGQITNFLTSKIPLLDLEGNVTGLMGISMDITHLKKKESQLRKLINITAVQNKKLINFAHIVSHNLRSHSANFAMLLKFLVDGHEEIDKDEILIMLTKASDNLMQTLEDLNEVVEINTNFNLKRSDLDLNQIVEKVQQNLSVLLEQHQVTIHNKIPKNLTLRSVPTYLESILLNLISNAAKYRSPLRKPVVTLEVEKEKDTLTLSISDNGMGIDLNKYGNKIFGMYKTFHQRKDARGLGLYIIKNQIEALGGSISVESQEGLGTSFKVSFTGQGPK